MDSEFAFKRARKRLEYYCTCLDEISEEFSGAAYDRKEELIITIREIYNEIEAEKERSINNGATDINIESTNYLPALQESSMYLEQALDPESNYNVRSCLHDAIISLSYYLNNIRK